MLLLALLLACSDDSVPASRRGPLEDTGEAATEQDSPLPPADGDTGQLDSGDGGSGDGGTSDGGSGDGGSGDGGTSDGGTGDGGSGDGGEAVDEVCYLGADRAGTTCLPVVAWSAGWGSDYDYPDPLHGSLQYLAPVRFIDLSTASKALYLAPNFQLDEFMQLWKGRYAVYQTHTVETLQAMRDHTGGAIVVNSGYRNVAYNASVGGATWSRHMYGDAVDMTSAVLGLTSLGDLCEDYGAGYVGLYTSHVHCDWRDDPLDPAFYDSGSGLLDDLAPLPRHDASLALDDGAWTAPATGFDEGEPLRRWTAWDADGRLLVEDFGPRFVAPPDTARVEVEVGGQVLLSRGLDHE